MPLKNRTFQTEAQNEGSK